MKGVILAGGSGTRLHPLTRITNKHLLPLYDRPMVTYAVEALVDAGIGELMLVTGGTHAGEFFRLLGNGHDYGIDRLLYAYQEQAGGIADALALDGAVRRRRQGLRHARGQHLRGLAAADRRPTSSSRPRVRVSSSRRWPRTSTCGISASRRWTAAA